MSALLVFMGLFFLSILLYAITRWVFAKLLKYSAPSFMRALGITLILFFFGILLQAPRLFIPRHYLLACGPLLLASYLFLAWYLIKRIHGTTTEPDTPKRLAANEYFVVGDNTTRSYDSRFLGPIKAANIQGVVSMIYWPLNRMRIIR